MSRTMPTECEHGEIIDWGDFGPCQGDCDHEGDCPNFPDCPDCMETRMTPEQTTAITACPVDDEGGVCGRDDCGRCGCDCLVPWLDGAGNHSPGCRIFRGRKNGSTGADR